MNFRKFYATLSLIISVFLFLSGCFILHYLSANSVSADTLTEQDSGVNKLLKPFVEEKELINFLVMVGDKEEANTDTMMLVNFNTENNTLNILSIPRDTRVNVGGLKIPKVNCLYARNNGKELVVNTISGLLGVKIDYYVYFNIATFRKIIDTLGGVDITVPVDMDYDDPLQDLHIHLKKGRQHMDGEKAEQFLRFRHPNEGQYTQEILQYYNGSDIKRIEAQQTFLKELIKQKANIRYLSKVDEIVELVFDNLQTDITLSEVLKMLKNVSEFKVNEINTFTLPGESRKIDEIWYYIYDKSQTMKIIQEYFS